jgi:predicted DNA-binding protein (UPF0278 family)
MNKEYYDWLRAKYDYTARTARMYASAMERVKRESLTNEKIDSKYSNYRSKYRANLKRGVSLLREFEEDYKEDLEKQEREINEFMDW